MAEIPRKVDKEVRRYLAELELPWEVVKKKNHYFVKIADQPMVCVASNGSNGADVREIKNTLSNLRRTAAAAEENHAS